MTTRIRPCLINGNVHNSERFFVMQGNLTQEYFVYCKENQRGMAKKDPLFGHIVYSLLST